MNCNLLCHIGLHSFVAVDTSLLLDRGEWKGDFRILLTGRA